jgi:hypothetical protein
VIQKEFSIATAERKQNGEENVKVVFVACAEFELETQLREEGESFFQSV